MRMCLPSTSSLWMSMRLKVQSGRLKIWYCIIMAMTQHDKTAGTVMTKCVYGLCKRPAIKGLTAAISASQQSCCHHTLHTLCNSAIGVGSWQLELTAGNAISVRYVYSFLSNLATMADYSDALQIGMPLFNPFCDVMTEYHGIFIWYIHLIEGP